MSVPVKLPSLGESVVDGTVSRWLVREGDSVEVDQSLCEVTTDKVDAEIPAPQSGVVERILVAEGETVQVGAELALLSTASEPTDATDANDGTGLPLATPVARRLAEEARVALSEIRGTGAQGRVTKSDVLAHAPADAPIFERVETVAAATPRIETAPPAAPPRARADVFASRAELHLEEGDRVVPMSAQRRIIAAHMVYSKQTSPHVGTVAEVDLGAVAALRAQRGKSFAARHGCALTYLPFIAHAVTRALREFPALNVSVSDDAIIERSGIHLSLAVETEKGLMAPVVRDADRLSLVGLALAIDDLSERARNKRITPDDLRGGTFTVSNPGRKGNLYGFAIINQPQVAILRMGELVKRPVVRSAGGEDAIVVRPMMHLALSYDHRAVDGSPANAFLYRIRELLEAGDFDL